MVTLTIMTYSYSNKGVGKFKRYFPGNLLPTFCYLNSKAYQWNRFQAMAIVWFAKCANHSLRRFWKWLKKLNVELSLWVQELRKVNSAVFPTIVGFKINGSKSISCFLWSDSSHEFSENQIFETDLSFVQLRRDCVHFLFIRSKIDCFFNETTDHILTGTFRFVHVRPGCFS